jgi:sulfite dehydrogenase
MKKSITAFTLGSLAAAFFTLAGASAAQALEIKLPPETATFKPSTMPGYQKVLQNCTACHSAQYMQTQPALSQTWWQGEVRKMKATYGAQIPDADMDVMAAYLFATYGSGKGADEANSHAAAASPASASAATATTAAAPAAAGKIDAQALLKSNNCLACHAVDHKVVGPAYKDVAARYSGKADAVAVVAQHIQQGGSGKWGAVPMPPFANLDDAQAKALATWVLQQH